MTSKLSPTLNRMIKDLLALGVRPGSVLLVHSSLSALGHVTDGAVGVITALRTALGPAGTLLLPALSYMHVTRDNPVFDILQTPSNVGIIPETFRCMRSVRRSLHPTHSVCGIGPLAEEVLAAHTADTTPAGPNSPFSALPRLGGQILMLGCGLEPNTSMHAIEEHIIPPYLFGEPITYQLKGYDRKTVAKTYTPHNFHNATQRYDRVEHILSAPTIRKGSVLAATTFLIESAALWESALVALRTDPIAFVEGVE